MSKQIASVHSVHIYDQDSDLITRLCAIVSTSLRLGDAVLIVATAQHNGQLVKELEKTGIDVPAYVANGRCTMLEAKQMLSRFMVNGEPDRMLFMTSIGERLSAARNAARSKNQGMTVFGEMVAVLWDEGNKRGALELEALWNEVLHDRAFHLHCAYARAGFINDGDMDAIRGAHSHVLQ